MLVTRPATQVSIYLNQDTGSTHGFLRGLVEAHQTKILKSIAGREKVIS